MNTPWRPTLGIDFGTTNTAAAWADQRGKVHPVLIDEMDSVLPSVIWFSDQDRYVVGKGARKQLINAPQHTIYGFKRFIGRSIRSPFVTRIRDRFSYKILEDKDGSVAVEVHGKVIQLVVLINLVIQRILEVANATTGQVFERCVLSVPSHYTFRQRLMVRLAAEMAGLEVRGMINEPTAAALYYFRLSPSKGTTMVFDLGGGTLDVTLISIDGHLVKVLATGGDAFLGGDDFDARIAQALAERFEADHDVDIQGKPVVMHRLMFASEICKVMLSQAESAPVRVVFAAKKKHQPLDLDYVVTRQEFESMVAPLVERCVGACDHVLSTAGIGPEELQNVILVGGQTRTPMVRQRLFSVFSGDSSNNMHPEISVAAGTALLGRMLDMPAGPALVDASSVPVWVSGQNVKTALVLPAATVLPSKKRVTLTIPCKPVLPIILVFYEALEASSVERDVVGVISVDMPLLAPLKGTMEIEISVNQSFQLDVALLHPDGTSHPLTLELPRLRRR